jgi:hypothetical protein
MSFSNIPYSDGKEWNLLQKISYALCIIISIGMFVYGVRTIQDEGRKQKQQKSCECLECGAASEYSGINETRFSECGFESRIELHN